MTGMAPVIDTARLRLRAPRLKDFGPYAAYYASPRAVWEDGPLDMARAWKEFASGAGLWSLRGYGSLSIEDRATGAYLGETGIYHPAHYLEPELGWMVVAEAEGRGIAREAAIAARDWAYRVRGLPPLLNYIDPRNLRSIRLAERLGARHDPAAPVPEGEGPCIVMRHPGPEEIAA